MSIHNPDLTLKYCTYLTVYSGNKLPPFYIGYSTVDKVLNKNYHGTPTSKRYSQIFKKEEKENPHLFKTRILTTHQSRKEATIKETKILVQLNVKINHLYINMANSESCRYNKGGYKHTLKQLEKISKRTKGKNNPMYGRTGEKHPLYGKVGAMKGKTHSKEARIKISLSKRGNKNHFYHKHWITNGIDSKIVNKELPIPEGWRKGLTKTKEHISKLPQNNKGFKFSEERKRKMSLSAPKHHSAEHVRKQQESAAKTRKLKKNSKEKKEGLLIFFSNSQP